MVSSGISGPTAVTLTVERLVEMTWHGQVRIPKFQRDFRWSNVDVMRLFDSIIKGYPIGSLLLWERNALKQQIRLGELEIDAPNLSAAWWVVDGQQRVTSLANTLAGQVRPGSRFALSYDIIREALVVTPSLPAPGLIELSTLFDLSKLLTWFTENSEYAKYVNDVNSITQRLRQFEIPAYIVKSEDSKVLRDIFDRMNNYGRRLTRAEVFSALHSVDEAESDTLTFSEMSIEIGARFSFGTIDDNTILGSILAPRGPDVRRDIRTEFANEDDGARQQAYQNGFRSLSAAVGFLQQELDVPHVSLLPYRYLLVTLARFFALHPEPSKRSRRLLRRWFWRAAIAGPEHFKGGTPNAGRVLCGRIIEGSEEISVSQLLEAVNGAPMSRDFSRFAPADASTKILLCAMWSLAPRDPLEGEPFSVQELSEVLLDSGTATGAIGRLVGGASLPEELRQSPASRCILPTSKMDPDDLAQTLLSKSQLTDTAARSAILRSHLLDEADSNRTPVGLIRARSGRLDAAVVEFLESRCEWHQEDTPSLSVFNLDAE